VEKQKKKTESTSKAAPKSRPVRCVVTSDKMNKSRVGTLERLVKHPQYGKYIRRRTKLMFHDEGNQSHMGDTVLLVQSRPHSSRKRFNLQKIVTQATR